MTRVDSYIQELASQPNWDEYLLRNSGLPGPRANLELAQAAARSGSEARYRRWLAYTPERAPANTPGEFVAFCGALGLGELLAAGRLDVLPELRGLAADPRWRMREGVAMALQRWGGTHPAAMIAEMRSWAEGNFLEQRAAVAGLCEPQLLSDAAFTRQVLDILDGITGKLVQNGSEKSNPEFKTLRQALGYCWSVAAAALPQEGIPLLKKWQGHPDVDAAWIIRENLKKNRLKPYLDRIQEG